MAACHTHPKRGAAKRRHHGGKPFSSLRDAIGTHMNWHARATSKEEGREKTGVLPQGGSGHVVDRKLGEAESRIMQWKCQRDAAKRRHHAAKPHSSLRDAIGTLSMALTRRVALLHVLHEPFLDGVVHRAREVLDLLVFRRQLLVDE